MILAQAEDLLSLYEETKSRVWVLSAFSRVYDLSHNKHKLSCTFLENFGWDRVQIARFGSRTSNHLLYLVFRYLTESLYGRQDSSLVEFITLSIIWDTKFSSLFYRFSFSWSLKSLSDIPDGTEVWSLLWNIVVAKRNSLLWSRWFSLINLE